MAILTGGNVISGGRPVLDTGDGHILTLDGVPGDGTAEIQDVSDGDATAGDFKLDLGILGRTAVIVFNETAANLKIILDALPAVTVTITGVGSVADPYVITFAAPGGNIPLMTVVDDTLTGGPATVAANTAGVLGAFGNIVAAGGLVKNNATGFVYENTSTRAKPAYTRIDTV